MRRTSFHLRLCGFVSFVMVVFAILYRVKIQSKTLRFASVVCTMYVRGHCGSIRVLCIFKWIISLLLSIIKFIAVPTRYSRAQWIGAHLQWISSIHGQQIATLTMRSMMSVWERCEIGRQTSGKNDEMHYDDLFTFLSRISATTTIQKKTLKRMCTV